MEPTVIAGLIGAGGTVVASIIAVIYSRRKSEAETRSQKIEQAIATGTRDAASVAPYSLGLIVKTVVLNGDGSGEQIQEWHKLVPNQRFDNLQIPIEMSIDGKNSQFGDTQSGEIDGCSLPVELKFEIFEDPKSTTKLFKGKFHVIGYCDPNIDSIGFYWKQKFTDAYRSTKEDVIQSYGESDWKTEYSASKVIFPTKELRFALKFPSTYDLKIIRPSPVVFIGGTHVVNRIETERIKSKFKLLGSDATITIESPLVGMSYAIAWMPPPMKC